ncbi:MAG: hypothetical protein U1E45_21575 [Geminicoccaceae bacterium]
MPLRRSFAHASLSKLAARLETVNGCAAAMNFGDLPAERAALSTLALVDLTPLPRTGFKGPGTPEWLTGQGVVLPDPNRAAPQEDGSLVLRLAPREALILGPLQGGSLVSRLDAAWPVDREGAPPRGYPVPRADSHCWFLLSGEKAPSTLAKICGVDLRPQKFGELEIAQTQAMRISVILVRDRGDPLRYHLLTDSASADYAWDCLVDAMAEFGGRPAGLSALA